MLPGCNGCARGSIPITYQTETVSSAGGDLGNTLELWYDYYSASENNNRLQSILVTGSSGDLLDLAYHYDPAGNILLITDTVNSGQVQNFGYDALDRLTVAETSGGGVATYDLAYGYDILGNISLKNDGVTTSTYSYGDADHVHAVTAVTGGWGFQYDATHDLRPVPWTAT